MRQQMSEKRGDSNHETPFITKQAKGKRTLVLHTCHVGPPRLIFGCRACFGPLLSRKRERSVARKKPKSPADQPPFCDSDGFPCMSATRPTDRPTVRLKRQWVFRRQSAPLPKLERERERASERLKVELSRQWIEVPQ